MGGGKRKKKHSEDRHIIWHRSRHFETKYLLTIYGIATLNQDHIQFNQIYICKFCNNL